MSRINKWANEKAPVMSGRWFTQLGREFRATVSLSAVATATSTDIAFITPATKDVHLSMNAKTNQGVQTVSLIEAPSGGGGGGTVVTAYNRNRSSTLTAGSTIRSGDTAWTGGTTVYAERLVSNAMPLFLGNEEPNQEAYWLLKPNTTYVIRVLTGAAGGNEIDVTLAFVETISGSYDRTETP